MIGFKGREQRAEGIEPGAKGRGLEVVFQS
jgi:hypothetical protein